jgi:hypothetical protein
MVTLIRSEATREKEEFEKIQKILDQIKVVIERGTLPKAKYYGGYKYKIHKITWEATLFIAESAEEITIQGNIADVLVAAELLENHKYKVTVVY